MVNKSDIDNYLKLKKKTNKAYEKIHSELYSAAVKTLKWKINNLWQNEKEKYDVLSCMMYLHEIKKNGVVLELSEYWMDEDFYKYIFVPYNEMFSDDWKNIALKKIAKRKAKKAVKEQMLEAAKLEKQEAEERKEYERLREKFEGENNGN